MRIARAVAAASTLAATMAATDLPAQGITAWKTGELVTGLTKQCYYNGLGSRYTRTVSRIELCPLSIPVTTQAGTPKATTAKADPGSAPPPAPAPRWTITAYRTGEEITGLTRQCHYQALGSRYTETVKSYQVCPLTITVTR
jgi:hypothetical protein